MSFNLLDLLIVVAAVMAAVGGYRIGFVTRVTSWIGLGLGLAVAARFLPKVVDRFHLETPSSRLLLAAGVLVVGAFIGQAIGLVEGSDIHAEVPMGPGPMADR